MSGTFAALDVSASGLKAQRQRINLLITNIANAQTTRTAEGGPYRRKELVVVSQPVQSFWEIFAELTNPNPTLEGVRVQEIVADPRPPELRFQPGHPDADSEGFVAYPNVNPLEEMAHLMSAIRAFEMNVKAFEAFKEMVQRSIDLVRR